jgi:hypothetical protein
MPGVYTWADGSTYSGEWFEGTKHGQGRYVYANGDTYEGTYKQGRKQGFGTATWANGARYQGQWHAGREHGQGRYTTADGQCYTGTFEHVRACVRENSPAFRSLHAYAHMLLPGCPLLAVGSSSRHKRQTIYERLCCVSLQAQGFSTDATAIATNVPAHDGDRRTSQEFIRPPLPVKCGACVWI